MPFEQLQPRLGAIPVQPVPHFNVQPVAPIGDIIKHGADQVASILDTFNPLNKAEREAKISLATMQTYAIQQAKAGNWEPFMRLHGHFQDLQEQNLKLRKLQNELDLQDISMGQYKRKKSAIDAAFGPTPGLKAPKGTDNTFHKSDEKTANDAIGMPTVPYRPVAENDSSDPSLVADDGDTMDDQTSGDTYDYPHTSPEDYWS